MNLWFGRRVFSHKLAEQRSLIGNGEGSGIQTRIYFILKPVYIGLFDVRLCLEPAVFDIILFVFTYEVEMQPETIKFHVEQSKWDSFPHIQHTATTLQ